MAERRMFAKVIIDSDMFLDMPQSSQLLYFHLCLRADDEGFINKPKSIMRLIGSKDDDIKLLCAKGFIIPFESGIIVIKHWRLHNYIRGDRLKETVYLEEKSSLETMDNLIYTTKNDDVSQVTDICQSNVSQMTDNCQPSDSIGKVRLGKDRIGKDSLNIYVGKNATHECNKTTKPYFIPPTVVQVQAYCKERNNNVDAEVFVNFYEAKGWMVGKNKMKDWKAAIRTWEKTSNQRNTKKTEGRLDWIDDIK